MKLVIVGDVHLSETSPRAWVGDYPSQTLNDFIEATRLGDVTLVLGDLFHKPVISEQYKLELVSRLRKEGKRIYTIWGNHDIDGLNLQSRDRTSLNLLSKFGEINILEAGSYKFEGVSITVLPLERGVSIPPHTTAEDSILVGHLFFESSLDKEFSLTKEQVFTSGYKYVFLGHDHEPYEDISNDDTRLVRLGSLCRNTSHDYNLYRTPQVAVLEVAGDKILSYNKVPIKTVASQLLFRPDCYEKPIKNRLSSILDIGDILNMFDKSNGEDLTVRKALNNIHAPSEVIDYLSGVYERAGYRL